MFTFTLRATKCAVFLVALTLTATASAQWRTFAASTGNDANPCSLAAPCRGLQAAVDAVLAGGEVVPLDSAGYGTLNITKAVTIATPRGVQASITEKVNDGITVNAGSATVTLRGLAITGFGTGRFGINHRTGNLIVEGVTISDFNDDGLRVEASGLLVVNGSTISNNDQDGIDLRTGRGGLVASLNRVSVLDNGDDGVEINDDNVVATIKNSVAAGNAATGFSNQSAESRMHVEGCVATDNGTGVDGVLVGEFSGNIRVSNSTITGNTTGIGTDVVSRRNNTVLDNVTNGLFTGFFSAQ